MSAPSTTPARTRAGVHAGRGGRHRATTMRMATRPRPRLHATNVHGETSRSATFAAGNVAPQMTGVRRRSRPAVRARAARSGIAESSTLLRPVSAQPESKAPIAVIGAALDLGSGRRGVDMGPSAVRYAQLAERVQALGYDLDDRGNVGAGMVEALDVGDPSARYWDAIKRTCEELAGEVEAAARAGRIPLVIGGDHAVAIGTLGGLASAHGAPGGVIWFDAHSDINTPATSPSGNVHGMPLAIALGLADDDRFRSGRWPLPMIAEESTVLIGVRSVDEGERRRMSELGLKVFTMHDIDRYGMHRVVEEAIEITSTGPFVHISFDMDVVDPDQAPGVGTPVRGGITYREAHLAMELVAKHGMLTSLELVEVNPVLDEHNQTASLAVELACSAFGARIL